MLSQKEIKKILQENREAFEALESFEKTGSVQTKMRMNFTIEREKARRFREYCKSRNISMSHKIEEYIETFI